MGIFDGIMILSDLDGTLTKHAVMSDEHLKSVQHFVDNGGNFCIATGRNETFLMESFPQFPMKNYCIVKNGTAIYDCTQKKYVWYQAVDRSVLDRVFYLLKVFPETERVTVHTLSQTIQLLIDEPDFEAKLRSIDEEILKVVIVSEADVCEKMQQHCLPFDDFQYIRSCPKLLELYSRAADKGICLEKLRAFMPQGTLFVGVGDFQNDIALLEAADIGVAVDNEYKKIQKYADWVAPAIENHPISWLIDKLETERLAGLI